MADEPQPDPPSGADGALTADELEIAEKKVAGGPGSSVRAIGEAVDLSASQVSRILRRPHVARWVARLQIDAQEAIRGSLVRNAPAALATIVSIMRNDRNPAAVRLTAAIALLDRTLPKAVHLSSPSGGPVEVDMRTDAERLRDAAANMAAADIGLPPVPEGGAYDDG